MKEKKPQSARSVTEHQIQNLNKLLSINSIINSTLEINSLLPVIMEIIKDIMETEASSLLVFEENTRDLVFKVALGEAGKELQEKYRVRIGQGIAGWVAENRKTVFINDAYSDPRFDPNYDKKTGYTTKSILCAPLLYKGRLLGVIQAINPINKPGFYEENVPLFETFADQAAVAIENANLYTNLEKKVGERTALLTSAYKKLEELDKAKTNFFANISHELRTPLTLILSPLESILEGCYGDTIPRDNEIFPSLHNNCIRLLRLINNLLDFSKIEAGKMKVRRQKSDLSKLLRHYSSNIKSGAESRGLKIEFIDNTNGLIAWIDQNLIEKAVYNMLSNAIKFTPQGGNITVRLEDEGDKFKILFTDTGIGIPEDMLESIFDRFTQVDSSLSRKYDGTGIGLSLTNEIVELHGGSISVKSRLGEGSTFTMTLPHYRPENSDADDDRDNSENIEDANPYLYESISNDALLYSKNKIKIEPVKESLKKILIVDDSPDMLNFLLSLLGGDYNMQTAQNGKEALKLLTHETWKPDLIIADVMMPEMDGYELTENIRRDPRFEGVPIILLTAKADIQMKVLGIEKGANDYIIKPFNPKELIARVHSQLELKLLRDRLMRANEILKQAMTDSSILVADIGHKFYNELWPFAQMIMVGKNLLKQSENGEEITRDYIEFANDNFAKCEQSLERIEDLKNKIKRNFGKKSEKINNKIKYIIEDLLTDFGEKFKSHEIALEKIFEFDSEMEIKVNAEQIQIALENILNNAIKALISANKSEKRIKIDARFSDSKFLITIEDNGTGIPDGVGENIFSMFFRVEKDEKKRGLGLGLHITRWIVEDCHRGKIEVSSEEGQYTRFKIFLPAEGDMI